jgi:hypothetical protein
VYNASDLAAADDAAAECASGCKALDLSDGICDQDCNTTAVRARAVSRRALAGRARAGRVVQNGSAVGWSAVAACGVPDAAPSCRPRGGVACPPPTRRVRPWREKTRRRARDEASAPASLRARGVDRPPRSSPRVRALTRHDTRSRSPRLNTAASPAAGSRARAALAPTPPPPGHAAHGARRVAAILRFRFCFIRFELNFNSICESQCFFDGGDCLVERRSRSTCDWKTRAGCPISWLGDGVCDEV